jgi:ubiquitin carboxyl-terminal hydrolase L5
MSWCTIESDPGVFTELISMLGVQGTVVEEIYSLEESEQQREQSFGLIFLFKWKQETDSRIVLDESDVPHVYFAKQVVADACATQAILAVLLNSDDIDIGQKLRDFKAFSSSLDSESKGISIGNSDDIRLVHNSFARPEPFVADDMRHSRAEKGDVYHFIAYVPVSGEVYE